MASEEMEAPYPIPHRYPLGEFLLLFDPLDGSSNIDVNVSVGSIFSVLRLVDPEPTERSFLQPGNQQLAARYPLWKSENKLAITSGDRSDYIVAALESSTSGVILTNNFLPPQNLISKASDKNIPMLLVPFDTFTTAKQVDDMIPLLTKDDTERIDILHKLVSQNVDIKEII